MLMLPLGTAAAWWLSHGRPFRGKVLIETLLTLPLVLPPTVVGFYLLLVLGRGTSLGEWVNDSAGIRLLFTWQGSDVSLSPILLLSHQDVVPVESGTESQWSHPPFDGVIADGFIWGRGAWDDKSGVLAILDAIEALLAQQYHPRRTILLAFGHDEEVGGRGAVALSSLLRERDLRPE